MTEQTKKKLVVAGGIVLCAVLAFLTALRAAPRPTEAAPSGAAETRFADEISAAQDEYPSVAPTPSASAKEPRLDKEPAPLKNPARAADAPADSPTEASIPSGTGASAASTPDAPQETSAPPTSVRHGSQTPEAPATAAPIVIAPPVPQTTPPSAVFAPDMEGAEQSIQPEVTRPVGASDGEPHEHPDDPALFDPSAPPATSQSSVAPDSRGLPGFDNVPYSGPNRGIKLHDMYENGNKIGIMD
jgi:hypothetical protein